MPDPIESILRPLTLPDRTKAAAWDAFQQAASPDDLQRTLAQMPLPTMAIQALLKAKGAADPHLPHMGALSEDRSVSSGDVQDDPATAFARTYRLAKRDLSDPTTLFQLLAMGALPKAAPMLMRGLTPSAGPAPAGPPSLLSRLGAAAEAAGPDALQSIIGYRLGRGVSAGQKFVGTLRGRGGSATAEAVPAPESAPTNTATALPPASAAASPASRPASQSPSAGTLTLTPAEQSVVDRLVAEGYDRTAVLTTLQRQRLGQQLGQRLGTPTDAEVASAVADRNATGRWPQDRR